MTLRALRSEHAHAVKMHRLTRMRGWGRAVARLNNEIMRRSRPVRTAATVAAKNRRHTAAPHSMFIR